LGVYRLEGGNRVLVGTLPPGRAGTKATLELMQQLAAEGARDVAIRERALAIVRMARVAPHDFDGELAALYTWVRDRIRFVRDVAGVEGLQAPRRTIEWGAGDCDDMATLLVALLRSIGHPARLAFRAIGTNRTGPRNFSHVYTVAKYGGREIALDPTVPGTPIGWEYPRATSRMELAL
jgi:transglutaminase-like putative cysteine protease